MTTTCAWSSSAPSDVWWSGDGEQVGHYLWGYESLWLPASLLASASRQRLADALFTGSRHADIGLHFNKGLAGSPPDAIAAAEDTAMNPAVLTAFALAIVANGQGPAYPGIPGHEPDVLKGRTAAKAIDQCVEQLRAVAGPSGSYVNETNYFEKEWQRAFWGDNYARLRGVEPGWLHAPVRTAPLDHSFTKAREKPSYPLQPTV